MKIVKLTAENIKKLTAVEITPAGAVVRITGANGSGKTSVLDSIMWGLGGKGAIQAQPIRKGADKGKIVLDLGDYIVTRRFTASDTTVIVEAKSGARYPSPQRFLDDLMGSISFDPLEFARMDPKPQLEMLRGLVRLDVDIAALEGLNDRDYEERTEINRNVKSLRAQASAIVVPDDLPAEKVDADALMDRLARASEENGEIERRKARREQAERDAASAIAVADQLAASLTGELAEIQQAADRDVADIDQQIEALTKRRADIVATTGDRIAKHREKTEARIAELRGEASALQAKLAEAGPLPAPVDIATLRAEVDRANRINAAIAQRDRRATLTAEADAEQKKADQLTANIEARNKAKADAIASAKFPVPGLSFGDGHVLLNGLPFDQASGAEQLRASVAIAMAANPTLRVLRIKDGSLLDENGFRLLAEMAADKDYQCWVESVDTSGRIGIVMEDGAVAAVNDDGAAAVQMELGAA